MSEQIPEDEFVTDEETYEGEPDDVKQHVDEVQDDLEDDDDSA